MARSAAKFATASSQGEAEDRGEAKGVEGRAWVYRTSPENLEDCRRQWRHGGGDFGQPGGDELGFSGAGEGGDAGVFIGRTGKAFSARKGSI